MFWEHPEVVVNVLNISYFLESESSLIRVVNDLLFWVHTQKTQF